MHRNMWLRCRTLRWLAAHGQSHQTQTNQTPPVAEKFAFEICTQKCLNKKSLISYSHHSFLITLWSSFFRRSKKSNAHAKTEPAPKGVSHWKQTTFSRFLYCEKSLGLSFMHLSHSIAHFLHVLRARIFAENR